MRSAVIIAGCSAALVIGSAGSTFAASLEALQGAWSMVGGNCVDLFDFSGGAPKFKDRGSSLNTGIIIQGNKIMGSNATCTATNVSENQSQYKVHMSCADSIMFTSVSVSFVLQDPQHFQRIDPDFPEITDDFQKCMPPQ